jgi:cation:H+ antiporter
MNHYGALILGAVCAAAGGELFVRGAVGLARWARVSPGIIAATVVAFATSSRELSVSINASLAGDPAIALGDALGSNIVNVALILGLALAISGIRSPRLQIRRNLPVALLIPVATGLLILYGTLSRLDGALMLSLLFAWLAATLNDARKLRSAAGVMLVARRRWAIVLSSLAGMLLLIGAGRLIVLGARGVALSFGIEEFVVGATLVAVGTSLPELATAVVAKLRGYDEISLGALLGSNIFNGLFIVAVAALIHPIGVDRYDAAIALVFGFLALMGAYPNTRRIDRAKPWLAAARALWAVRGHHPSSLSGRPVDRLVAGQLRLIVLNEAQAVPRVADERPDLSHAFRRAAGLPDPPLADRTAGGCAGTRTPFLAVRAALFDDHHRHLREHQHLGGDTAEQHPRDAGAAVRTHHDQVGATVLRGRDDVFGRVAAFVRRGAQVHTLRLGQRGDFGEGLLGLLLCGGFVFQQGGAAGRADAGIGVGLAHIDGVQRRAGQAGKPDRAFGRSHRDVRTVGGQQDLVVHGGLRSG